jgi:NADH-quinone oxidoreductase subunit J
MNAQFLAIVNIIVYAGAIMVLFLFVIMLMNLNADVEPQKGQMVQIAGVISGGILFLIILAAIRTANVIPIEGTSSDIGLMRSLGKVLFSQKYILPFEISSVLFLSAMIGAVVIGKKEPGAAQGVAKTDTSAIN